MSDSPTPAPVKSGGTPLAGQRILITRPREQAAAFVRGLEALGARPVVFPTVEILPLDNSETLDQAIRGLAEQDWLVFTSVNGVGHFLSRCEALGRLEDLDRLDIAAIGPQTARLLEDRGLAVSLVPEEYRAEGILAALEPDRVRGKRFLLARGRHGDRGGGVPQRARAARRPAVVGNPGAGGLGHVHESQHRQRLYGSARGGRCRAPVSRTPGGVHRSRHRRRRP